MALSQERVDLTWVHVLRRGHRLFEPLEPRTPFLIPGLQEFYQSDLEDLQTIPPVLKVTANPPNLPRHVPRDHAAEELNHKLLATLHPARHL